MRFRATIPAAAVLPLLGLALVAGCVQHRPVPATRSTDLSRVVAELRRATAPTPCVQGQDPFLVVLERAVAPGASFRVVAVSERPLGDALARSGERRLERTHRRSAYGPPYALHFRGRAPAKIGEHPVRLTDEAGKSLACVRVKVSPQTALAPEPTPATGIWTLRRSWNDAWERVFSAWIAYLFRPLPGQPAGWRPLHTVLLQQRRNFLYNRLGYDEDNRQGRQHVHAWADCGDTPYQLRAYFAWKFGLPFRFRRCSRGNSITGPRCPQRRDNLTAEFDRQRHPVRRFNAFIRQGVAWYVHSGTLRTLPEDEKSDFYPIRLDRDSLRPGTVFVDIAGHALIVTQWDEQGLYAIDGHPDMSVTRRRFSQRHFRWFRGTRTGGFKAFRPLRVVGGRIVPQANSELRRFFSVEQYQFANRRDFYREMSRLIADHAG